jgi:hypothetical protein
VLERAQRRRGCSATRIGCIRDHGTAIFIVAASPTEGWVGTKRLLLLLLLLLLLVHGSRESRNRCARTVRPSRFRVKAVQQVINVSERYATPGQSWCSGSRKYNKTS